METLSSATTFTYKFLFPAVWLALFGFVTGLGFVQLGPAAPAPWVLATFWVLSGWLIGRTSAAIKRVQLDRDALVVSNFRRELRVPVSEIAGVTQNRALGARPVTIFLRHDTPFGRAITFIPPFTFRLLSEDPIVARLRLLGHRHR